MHLASLWVDEQVEMLVGEGMESPLLLHLPHLPVSELPLFTKKKETPQTGDLVKDMFV